nr:MAG TPA: hypothetical protein [Caudoviricetes sp.]
MSGIDTALSSINAYLYVYYLHIYVLFCIFAIIKS